MKHLSECCESNPKDKCDEDENTDDIEPMIQISLNKIIAKEGYLNHKSYKRVLTTNGGNYLGKLYEFTIKGETDDGHKETHLFVKEQIGTTNISEIVEISKVYSNEAFFYDELSKIFAQVQDDAGLLSHERHQMAKSYNESSSNVLILENLSKRGFQTLHRMDVMTLKFTELSIIELAKFHGLSFVIQTKRPNYFKQKIEPMQTICIYNDTWKVFAENLTHQVMKIVNLDTRNKLIKYVPTLLDRFPKYMAGEYSTIKCLCHGDYRVNNIMIKQMEGEITEVVPLDYQFLYYGSPMADIMYLVSSATDREFRKDHLEDLKNLYYNSLKDFLKRFEIDVNAIFTRKQFEQEYNEHLELGLMYSLLYLPWCFIAEDDVPDFSKENLKNCTLKFDPRFKERVEGFLQDYNDWGFI